MPSCELPARRMTTSLMDEAGRRRQLLHPQIGRIGANHIEWLGIRCSQSPRVQPGRRFWRRYQNTIRGVAAPAATVMRPPASPRVKVAPPRWRARPERAAQLREVGRAVDAGVLQARRSSRAECRGARLIGVVWLGRGTSPGRRGGAALPGGQGLPGAQPFTVPLDWPAPGRGKTTRECRIGIAFPSNWRRA